MFGFLWRIGERMQKQTYKEGKSKMKSKNKKWAKMLMIFIAIAIVASLVCFFAPTTPEGATRLALLMHGFVREAATAKLERQSWTNEGEIVLFVDPPPHASDTDTRMFQWNAKKHGIFYVSNYGVA
jgi:hypothetical protein